MASNEDVKAQMEAMLTGNFKAEVVDEETTDELEEETEGVEEEESYEEETNLDEEALDEEPEEETEEEPDGETPDTSEEETTKDETQQEDNTPVEPEEETKDEPESKDDGQKPETSEGVDYQKQLADLQAEKTKLQEFYDEVTKDFKANGKTVEGIKDTKRIIAGLQQGVAFNEKMKGFKQYRPAIEALKEANLIDNPEQLNLLLDIQKGNKEALKAHIKQLGLDPVTDLDVDEDSNYQQTNHLKSEADYNIEDSLAEAKELGVESRVTSDLTRDWDDKSINTFLSNPVIRKDVLTHLSNGVYDMVQKRVVSMNLDDNFNRLDSLAKYEAAYNSLADEQAKTTETTQQETQGASTTKAEPVVDKAAEEAYVKKVEAENKAAEARNKAASVSKRKPKGSSKGKKTFDPLKANADEFKKFFTNLQGGFN